MKDEAMPTMHRCISVDDLMIRSLIMLWSLMQFHAEGVFFSFDFECWSHSGLNCYAGISFFQHFQITTIISNSTPVLHGANRCIPAAASCRSNHRWVQLKDAFLRPSRARYVVSVLQLHHQTETESDRKLSARQWTCREREREREARRRKRRRRGTWSCLQAAQTQ